MSVGGGALEPSMDVCVLAMEQRPGWVVGVGWGPVLLAAGVLLVGLLVGRAWLGLHGGGRGAWARFLALPRAGAAEDGTATIEFALVFPILLTLILLLVQVALLMVGNLFVHYAAFASTRAAVVQIPRVTAEEPINFIMPHTGSAKFRAIQRAASTAVVPVCGRAESSTNGVGVDPVAYADALRQHFAESAGERPGWVDTLAEQKMRYANNETQVELLVYDEVEPDAFRVVLDDYTFGPRDPITVRVTHRLNLGVPYVRLFFADGEHTTATGPGGYAIVQAQTTMVNQGVDPSLPSAPDAQRIP